MTDRFESELAKELDLLHKSRRSREILRLVEEARNDSLETSLRLARGETETRFELRSSRG